jgi:hypothetical protein
VAALEQINAVAAAKLLKLCNDAFPDGIPPVCSSTRARIAYDLRDLDIFPSEARSPGSTAWDDLRNKLKQFANANWKS